MFLSIIGNEKSRRFLFHIREKCLSVSKGGTLLPRVGFTAPSEARAVIETQESKVPPEDTLFSISDVGWDFLLFYTEFF